ncbi:hypothetical protein J6590_035740 [Homalodisca vitripennis]|nr:hypothetical protein J6590_103496 [Homalodisca vitripennis]KAG8326646.1 hypothetical protein J6590_035740 [Homalodisca vitripennis]
MESQGLVFVALLLAALALVHAKIDYDEYEKKFNVCKEETKAEETFEETIKNEKIPTSDKGMCLVECLLRSQGVYDSDGKYKPEGAKEYFSKVFSHLPENIEKSIAIAEECSKMDVEGLDKCEAAVKHLSCAKIKSAQQNISIKD